MPTETIAVATRMPTEAAESWLTRVFPSLPEGLLLTGQRQPRAVWVALYGRLVVIPLACYSVLMDLVAARCGPVASDYSSIPSGGNPEYTRIRIHRLRTLLDVPPSAGNARDFVQSSIIQTGVATEYRLSPACPVSVAPCFFTLPPQVVPRDLMDKIGAALPRWPGDMPPGAESDGSNTDA